MKKLLVLLLALLSFTVTALAAEIPYLDRVQPEYRAAAENFMFLYTYLTPTLKPLKPCNKQRRRGAKPLPFPPKAVKLP